jgi:hypothetical protein
MAQHRAERDPRVAATAAIWGISVGLLGVCVPLIALTNSGVLLPLLVLVGASVSTSAIWLSSRSPQPAKQRKLAQTVVTLEERVTNLEAICSSVDWDLSQPVLPATKSSK